MTGKPSLDAFWEERLRSMERRGASLEQIAEAFGVSTRTALRWRGRLGMTRSAPTVAHPRSDREHARQLLADGCSFAEAGRSVGVTAATIRRWFPDARPWTRDEIVAFAVQARRMNNITTITNLRDRAERRAS